MFTEIPEPTVEPTSTAAADFTSALSKPTAADTLAESGPNTQAEEGEELSKMMSARHMSIRER